MKKYRSGIICANEQKATYKQPYKNCEVCRKFREFVLYGKYLTHTQILQRRVNKKRKNHSQVHLEI